MYHHKVTEWLRLKGPYSPPSPNPCCGQGCPPSSGCPSNLALGTSRDGAPTALGSGARASQPSECRNRDWTPRSNLNFSSFHLKPFHLVFSLPDHIERWSPSFYKLPLDAVRSSWSLHFSKQNKPSFLSLSSEERCSSPLNISVALLWSHSNNSSSSLSWGPQAWTQCCR